MPPKKVKIYEYVVMGRRAFPVDMLRYDRATPAREQDSSTIANSFTHRLPGRDSLYEVWLRSNHLPTEGRWESFGWKVLSPVKEMAS